MSHSTSGMIRSAGGSKSPNHGVFTASVKRITAYSTIGITVAVALGVFGWFWHTTNDVFAEQSLGTAVHATTVSPASTSQSVKLIAVGDIMLSRNVGSAIVSHHDVNYPFKNITSFLKTGDFVFANLETPITAGAPVLTGSMTFRSDPGVEKGLKNAGVTIVSLANNHTMNKGVNGMRDTLSYLDKAGIKHAGGGMNITEALTPAIVTVKGVRFAFLAFNDSDVVPASYGATASHAGTALMDAAVMAKAVKAAKKKADVVIVSMHSGTEYKPTPNSRQTSFAHAAIDAGATIVIGHHPHVVQTVEKYKGKWIIYSLGNFVFDQMWSNDTRRGMTATITFKKKAVEHIDYAPVLIENYAQPRLLTGKDGEAVIARLKLPKQ